MTKTTASLLVLCGLAAAGAVPALYGCGGGQPKPAATGGESTDSSALPEPAVLATASAAPADSSSAAANDTASPLAQVLTTDPGQIQKIFQAAIAAPAAIPSPRASATQPRS
jgi:hypothetical protein